MTDIEQIMAFLEAHQQLIDHLEDGIDKLWARVELIERKLKENYIGE